MLLASGSKRLLSAGLPPDVFIGVTMNEHDLFKLLLFLIGTSFGIYFGWQLRKAYEKVLRERTAEPPQAKEMKEL